MRTIWWFIYFWLYLIRLLPQMRRASQFDRQGQTQERDAIVDKEVQAWARALMRVAGVKVQVSGLENIPQEPCVFVSNHQGNFDIPLMLGYLDKPHGFVAKIETKKLPWIRVWMQHLNCIFIDRKDARQSLAALNNSADLLSAGYSLIIFPEGTRSKGHEMGEFKQGALKMAFKNSSPIVPVVVDGTYRIMEQQGGWIKPAEISLKILPLVSTEGLGRAEAKELPEVLRAKIQAELNAGG